MTDNITLVGVVATPPKSMQTASGLSIVSFRLASSQRRYDRTRNAWVDADTNWYSVTAFRQLADNASASLAKGDRVIVAGRLRVRSWENGEKSGTAVEVDADALGPDLLFGTTSFTRVAGRTPEPDAAGAQDPQGPADTGSSPSPTAETSAAGALPAEPAPAADPGTVPSVAAAAPAAVGKPVAAPASVAPQWHPASDEAPF
ncbi:hypothetical protein GCM10025867_22040 [Frondihabitans sucicola]|uniref:Single-stranded DNA-binding protein n=1 Tax=Frondihabitans sucicola TaxID=1268041 RepID=A0ABM8GNG9_9MICO|nr:single-stranded DNA-binding protein [Frondihabitans sucicola]BDZ49963.1 hypothetical protein GCM10025867_22040 [Frondihabitans sucicola]